MKHTAISVPSYENLSGFTREKLRVYARKLKVPVGQNKDDTIRNILGSRDAAVKVRLVVR